MTLIIIKYYYKTEYHETYGVYGKKNCWDLGR